MPHHKSCKKRLLTSRKSRLYNRTYKAEMRNALRDFRALTDSATVAEKLPGMISMLDRMSGKGIIKKETAGRLKSRLYAFHKRLG